MLFRSLQFRSTQLGSALSGFGMDRAVTVVTGVLTAFGGAAVGVGAAASKMARMTPASLAAARDSPVGGPAALIIDGSRSVTIPKEISTARPAALVANQVRDERWVLVPTL